MEPTIVNESTAAQRGNAPANVSVDQLTAMLKRKPAPAAAARPASPVNEAAEAGAGKGRKKTTTTTRSTAATDVAAGESGSSPESSTGAEGGEGGTEAAKEAGALEGSEEAPARQEPRPTGEETADESDAAEPATDEEAAPEGDADADEGGDTEEDGDGAEVPKAIKQMRNRIGKLVGQRNDLNAQLTAAQAELAQAKAAGKNSGAQQAPAGMDPRFGNDAALTSTMQQLQQAGAIVDWAEEALDQLQTSGEESVNVNGQQLGRAEVRRILRNAQEQRTELTAAKASRTAALEQSFRNSLAQHDAQAARVYPWMAKPESEEYQTAARILQEIPGVLARPDRALLIGDFIAGRKARLARGAGNPAVAPKPAVKPKPAPLPANGGVGGARVDAKKAAVTSAAEKFKQSGRATDLVALLKMQKAA